MNYKCTSCAPISVILNLNSDIKYYFKKEDIIDEDVIDEDVIEKRIIKNNELDLFVRNGLQISCPNLGNTCYINSVLQIFFHCDRLYSELREIIDITDDNTFINFLNKIRNMYVTEQKINMYEQCDSYLLLSFLLDKINTLFPSKFNPYYSVLLHAKIKCKKCEHVVHQRQCENVLYLRPTEETNCIKDMKTNEFYSEELEYKCTKCQHNLSSKKVIIDNLPEYLFITLQHFGESNINFNIEKRIWFNGIEYELAGMIEHLGCTPNSGHYVSYIQERNKWFLYDDSRISECYNIDEICHQNCRQYKQVLVIWYRIYRISDEEEDEVEDKINDEDAMNDLIKKELNIIADEA
jgi:ubiquitin C-terminal hydrolase